MSPIERLLRPAAFLLLSCAFLLAAAPVAPVPAKKAPPPAAAAEEGEGEGEAEEGGEEPATPAKPAVPEFPAGPAGVVAKCLYEAAQAKDSKAKEAAVDRARAEAEKVADAGNTPSEKLDAIAAGAPLLCRVVSAYLQLAEMATDPSVRTGAEAKAGVLARKAGEKVVDGRKAMEDEKKNLEDSVGTAREKAFQRYFDEEKKITSFEQKKKLEAEVTKQWQDETNRIAKRIDDLELYEVGKDDLGFGYWEVRALYLQGRTSPPDERAAPLAEAEKKCQEFLVKYKLLTSAADGRFLLAEIQEAQGGTDAALKTLTEVMNLRPPARGIPPEAMPAVKAHYDSLARRAVWRRLSVLQAAGRIGEALKWMDEIPKRLKIPENARARVDLDFDKFKILMESGRKKEAFAIADRYKRAEAGKPPKWYPYYYKALIEFYGEEEIRGIDGFRRDAESAFSKAE
ncbi:MAG: hypothetical protein AAB215_04760, partial [Planctomycetota bacterium]